MKYLNLKFLFLFFALAVALPPAWAEEVTVAEGTTESDVIPLNGYDFDNCKKNQQIQMIYPSDMLTNMNGATITRLKFYTRSGVKFHEGKINVAMGTTTESAFDSNPTPITGLTQVIGDMSVSTTTGEWELELSTPFTYNGGNLVIEFVQTEDGSWGDTYFYGQNQTNASFYATYSAVYLTNTYNVESFLPKVTFTYDSGETPVVTVAKPVFDPVDGTTFEENLTVSLTCATTDATIQYSYNGEYFTDYSAPIVIDETTTIYAKAVLGTNESAVVQATYTKEAAPQPSTDCPAVIEFKDNGTDATDAFADVAALKAYITSGEDFVSDMTCEKAYPGATGVKFSSSKANGYLTIDLAPLANGQGSWKTSKIIVNAKKYGSDAAAISVNGSDAVSVTENYVDYEFPVTSTDPLASIRIDATKRLYVKSITIMHECGSEPVQVSTPTFNPAQGEFTEAQNVTIACSTPGATIHYTTDGTEPTAESAVYDEAIAVGETMTIKAIAMKEGMTNSEIATATYTINIPSGEGTTFVKVTAADQLVAGKKYIFVYRNKALGVAPTGNFLSAIDVTAGDEVTVSDDGVAIMTLGGTAGHYTLALGDNYLHAVNSTSLDFGASTEWAIAQDSNSASDNGFRAKHADCSRAVRYQGNNNRFGNYSTTDANSEFAWIYVEKSDEPVVTELTVALDPAEKTYTVGDVAKIMVNVENGNDDTMVSYKINDGEEQDYNAETGIVLPNNKAKEYTVTVYATDGEREATATGTYSFTAAPAFEVTLTPNKEGNYTVGDEAIVTVAVDKYIGEEYLVTYTIGDSEEQVEYNAETGIILPNDKAGDVTVTVYVTDGYDHAEQEYTATYHFDAAPDIVVTLDPASGSYYIGEQVTVTVTAENTIGDYEVTYKIGDGEELDYEDGITIPSDQEGTVNLTVTVVDGYHDGAATATGAYTFAPRPVVDTPTFSLVAGSYTGEQTLNISCATENATILYSTDGGNNWTEDNTVTLTEDCTVMAKATVDGMTESPVATAAYIIDIPAELPTIEPFDGYYKVKNLGNNKYANIAGRKTLNFTNDIDKMAGTVIRIQTDNHGKVLSLRSQAADLQGYADRAMNYVPTFVHLVAEKLDAEGVGELFGENGVDAILEKFKEAFDAHLYVEPAEGGYRIYGKTPSMQHVVDFYRENQDKVEAKLPMLETAINNAIDKILEKTNGSGASILEHFSLHTIWEKMGGTLTEPVDDASTMEFYRQVLNNKNYVWDFAYETAMIYWTNLKNHPKYETDIKPHLGEYADYLEKIENVRPDFKYYIVQDNDKPDFISQGNKDITNNASRTIWSVEPRTEFTVNIPADNKYGDKYVTTLYTDFAYDLPNDVTAFTVTEITEDGKAKINILKGTIPAQTPVLLMAKATEITVTLNTTDGTAPTDNLLVGADYFIKKHEIVTPQVEQLFTLAKSLLGESFYDSYIKDYEYLMLKTAGTVNNKYFWGLTNDDLLECIGTSSDGVRDCEVRNLSMGEEGLGFYSNMTAPANEAFIDNLDFNPVKLWLRGDVDRDGDVDIADVTALIDILLGKDTPENNYDYEAADFDLNGTRNIDDVTSLIDFLLGYGYPEDIHSGN